MAQPREPARTRAERVQATSSNIGDTQERVIELKAVHREKKDIADQLKEAQRLVGQLTQTIVRLEREIRIFHGEEVDGRGQGQGPEEYNAQDLVAAEDHLVERVPQDRVRVLEEQVQEGLARIKQRLSNLCARRQHGWFLRFINRFKSY
ncbi:hypothetical protein OC842_007862 [Tilletia horrida]|uniref:Uncharacterized protein n=1 Tax=Tilletia horrida TaxID=155126 RepID=A0AAN6JM01_9BASI|nr:hypothetical protein OC842_007862 [Tilletia horrida]